VSTLLPLPGKRREPFLNENAYHRGTSLVVQCLGLHTYTAGDQIQPLVRELRSHMLRSVAKNKPTLSHPLMTWVSSLLLVSPGKTQSRQIIVIIHLRKKMPASDAEVHLVLGDQKLESNIMYNGDSVLAEAWLEENEEGTHSLKCSVNLGEKDRRTRSNVTIYSFPVPTLTLSPPEVSEWTTVAVECVTRDGAAVTLNGISAEPPGPRAQLKLNVSADDHGSNFSCSAALKIAGQVVHKNQTRELHVLYGPRLDQRDCLGNWTWQEGSEQTLKCEARGNPIPKLNCSRKGDGASLPIGDLRPVKREVAGTYLCRATSTRGGVTREVVLNVLYGQNILDIVIPVVAVVLILGALGTAGYIYNYQRKIQIYELQKARKAQEEAALKLHAQSTPP
ncbi:hypothetical protein FD754_010156, partial [Muntiacus muntjak]